MTSTINQTTIAQVGAYMGYCRHLTLIQVDDRTIRFHRPGRVARSVDVRYERGSDTYTVQAHEIRGVDVKTQEWDGLYAEDIGRMVETYTNPPSRR